MHLDLYRQFAESGGRLVRIFPKLFQILDIRAEFSNAGVPQFCRLRSVSSAHPHLATGVHTDFLVQGSLRLNVVLLELVVESPETFQVLNSGTHFLNVLQGNQEKANSRVE